MAQLTGRKSNRFWLEITDRADVGANLNAPLYDKNGHPNWTYDFVQEIKEGDKVFHYKGSAIVGVSRATGQAWFDDVIWAARGSASRSARIRAAPAAGAVCGARRIRSRLSPPSRLPIFVAKKRRLCGSGQLKREQKSCA